MRLLPALLLLGCNEYRVYQPPPPPPAEPPGYVVDAQGEPPDDWNTCASGHFGLYFNLPAGHPMVAPEDTDAPAPDLATADFWAADYFTFQRYDPSIDWGANWWPVDDGLEDDPHGFAVQWTSWLRVLDGGTIELVLAAADDVELLIDDEVVATAVSAPFQAETIRVDLQPGQYPVQIRYAQRVSDANGFRFRLVSTEAARLCYPEFPDG